MIFKSLQLGADAPSLPGSVRSGASKRSQVDKGSDNNDALMADVHASSNSSSDESSSSSSDGSSSPKLDADSERRILLEDASHEAPPGCSLRRYKRSTGGLPFWMGTLPPDRSDSDGKKSRQRAYGHGSRVRRSEEDAKADVRAWLDEWG